MTDLGLVVPRKDRGLFKQPQRIDVPATSDVSLHKDEAGTDIVELKEVNTPASSVTRKHSSRQYRGRSTSGSTVTEQGGVVEALEDKQVFPTTSRGNSELSRSRNNSSNDQKTGRDTRRRYSRERKRQRPSSYDARGYTSSYERKRSRHGSSPRTPRGVSPWDCVAPDPTPIRACGSSELDEVRRDGSELIPDYEWENLQLLSSGVSRRTKLKTAFENEEKRISLLFNKTNPPFLEDVKIAYTKQSNLIEPVKDPTSEMAKRARLGSQITPKSRRKTWDLADSKVGGILGLEKSAEQIDADTAVVGEERGHLQNDAKFKHFKKGEAVSEFELSNTSVQQRKQLPIYSVREELLQVVRENQVVIVVGETGSGKTTQLTQYLHEDGYTTNNGIVGCTQPRGVAAMSVAKRVSVEMGTKLGDRVGYAIRFQDKTGPTTVIKYVTDGVLLRETLQDPGLEKYRVIVMDEAHERSINTDVLFGILKKLVARRRDLKLIVASENLDVEKFSHFFGSAPRFCIPGKNCSVQISYSGKLFEDYIEAAINKVMEIHIEAQNDGDILIFMTGQMEIEDTCHRRRERMKQFVKSSAISVRKLKVLPIYSRLPAPVQAQIFQKAEGGARKCIVATNIAETSVTIDGISFVIDCGYAKMKVYKPNMGVDALQVFPCSRAAADQRAGRCGRTGPGPGICYRLYTRDNYRHEMLSSPVPEIQRTHLGNVLLILKSLKVDNIQEFNFMDPPPLENVVKSMYQLWVLGALDNAGNLTDLGRQIVKFPLDPPLAKMLLMGEQLGCVAEIVTIVAMMSVPSVFSRPKDRVKESDSARKKLLVPESDHLTLLNVYNKWERSNCSDIWCSTNFLQAEILCKAAQVRRHLLRLLESLNIHFQTTTSSDMRIVKKAISSAYFLNLARVKGNGYVNCSTDTSCHLHITSALSSLRYPPEFVVYHEICMTSLSFMQCVTAVEPEWLAELSPDFFTVGDLSHIRDEHKDKREQFKARMQEDMKIWRKEQAEVQRELEDNSRQKSKNQKSAMHGSKIGYSTHVRPKRVGL